MDAILFFVAIDGHVFQLLVLNLLPSVVIQLLTDVNIPLFYSTRVPLNDVPLLSEVKSPLLLSLYLVPQVHL